MGADPAPDPDPAPDRLSSVPLTCSPKLLLPTSPQPRGREVHQTGAVHQTEGLVE